jgi:catechol 2,3-dioxygenase-like lactoylglutathione lyase family enzyme
LRIGVGRSSELTLVIDQAHSESRVALPDEGRFILLSDGRVAPTLAVSNMERARKFYEETLSLTIDAEVEGTIRYKCGGGTGLALFEAPTDATERTVAAFEFDDIEREVQDLRGRGVEVEGIITLPSGLKRAFFKDPDGNVIGMRQL